MRPFNTWLQRCGSLRVETVSIVYIMYILTSRLVYKQENDSYVVERAINEYISYPISLFKLLLTAK